MNLNLQDWISILIVISYFVVAWWNSANSRGRVESQTLGDNSAAMKALNESIALASQRALDAEQRYMLAQEIYEKRIADAEAREAQTEADLKILKAEVESSQTYRMMFDVTLGLQPDIIGASIKNISHDRRVSDRPVSVDRRKKNTE